MPQLAEPEYEQMFGIDSYLSATAKLYRGIKFRKGIILYMAENTFIGDNCVILVPKLKMEKGSQICAGTVLAGKDEVILEENAVIGYNSVILSSSDTPSWRMNDASPLTTRKIRTGPIKLGKNSFVGSLCLIMPSVVIGENSICGAKSYIDKNLPPNIILIPQQKFLYSKRPM